MQCMRLIKKGGQALSFFVLILRHSSMDSFGVRSLGSAAAQGGQDTFHEHENGSPLTGWDASVQASRDASYHGSGTGQMGSSEASKAVGSSDASSYLQSPHTYYAQTPQAASARVCGVQPKCKPTFFWGGWQKIVAQIR